MSDNDEAAADKAIQGALEVNAKFDAEIQDLEKQLAAKKRAKQRLVAGLQKAFVRERGDFASVAEFDAPGGHGG
ncbi:MAG: hypothetical protein AAF721_00310 [Myxococcota bacterium]